MMEQKGCLYLIVTLLFGNTLLAGGDTQVKSLTFEEREASQIAKKWGFASSLAFLAIAGRCLSQHKNVLHPTSLLLRL